MKRFLKGMVVNKLNRQVRKLYKKHQFKTIAVVGSIGKTSTKFAIASVLGQGMRVRYQQGNYNDIVSVPLIYFGHELPGLTNIIAWMKIFRSNKKQINGDYPFDAVVVELGTDFPGNIAQFKSYVKADIAVVTAVTPEHMEYFADLDAVAKEELTIVDFSTTLVYSTDFIKEEHRKLLPDGATSYGIKNPADYHLANIYHSASGLEGDIKHGEEIYLHFGHEVVSEMQLYSMLAAVVVGNKLEMKRPDITTGIANIHPVSGRLRRLRGINNSTIIDDSYNASPDAVKAALDSLYDQNAPQRIAVLGSMNEMGKFSEAAHKEIGEYCDPSKLAMVVTVGKEANTILASAAEARGCQVRKFDNPYRAGEFLATFIQADAAVLAKGSESGIFLEEALKSILADPEDAAKLVRQTPKWMKIKQAQFKEG